MLFILVHIFVSSHCLLAIPRYDPPYVTHPDKLKNVIWISYGHLESPLLKAHYKGGSRTVIARHYVRCKK